jgi:hypothetical protein
VNTIFRIPKNQLPYFTISWIGRFIRLQRRLNIVFSPCGRTNCEQAPSSDSYRCKQSAERNQWRRLSCPSEQYRLVERLSASPISFRQPRHRGGEIAKRQIAINRSRMNHDPLEAQLLETFFPALWQPLTNAVSLATFSWMRNISIANALPVVARTQS